MLTANNNEDHYYLYRKTREQIALNARLERIKSEFDTEWSPSTLKCECGGNHNQIFLNNQKVYVCPVLHCIHWHRLALKWPDKYTCPTDEEYWDMLGRSEC